MGQIARRISLAAAVAALALACGGEETKPAGGAPAATPAQPAPSAATAPGAPMAIEDMYQWDPARGAARDLAADSQDCQSQISGQGLAGVAQHIECMKGKGWRTREPGS